MKLYNDIKEKRKILRKFIQENPNATHRDIKEKLHIKVMKIYSGGLEEAFKDAGVKSPRTFKRMSKKEKRKIIIDFIRKNPNVKGHIIKRETKINFLPLFKNTEEMFRVAQVLYVPKYNTSLMGDVTQRKNIIFDTIRKNPHIGLNEMNKILHMSLYRHFHDIRKLYEEAGIKYLGKGIKMKIKKQKDVIEFIKKNTFATQREINFNCKTKVQVLFGRGIFEAYEKAGVPFPFERLTTHGIAIKKIRDDAKLFEVQIAKGLSCYGNVNRLVKTKRGFADIIFERKGKKIAIEIKHFKTHEISITQIKQLNKYLEDIGANLGFLICLKKPKKDSFLIGKNKIFILTDSELYKIPEIMDPSSNG